MTNFLGNETSDIVLASFPQMIIFGTKDECYAGEMQGYETIELYHKSHEKQIEERPRGYGHRGELFTSLLKKTEHIRRIMDIVVCY